MCKKIYVLLALAFFLTPTVYCEDQQSAEPPNLDQLNELLNKMQEPKESPPDLGEVELSLREKLHFFWELPKGEKWRQIKTGSNENWTYIKEYVSNNKMLCALLGLNVLETILLISVLRDLRRGRPYFHVRP